jgi:hypothetical protein
VSRLLRVLFLSSSPEFWRLASKKSVHECRPSERWVDLTALSKDEEYECFRHAIDAGLEALGVGEHVTLRKLMEAFYNFE